VSSAITNTSPLLYLHRAGVIHLLPRLFDHVWAPQAVAQELQAGAILGHDVPLLAGLAWLELHEPQSMPSEWLALDLGAGELAAMALALENPDKVVLLDDLLARRTARAAGLTVWGTLKVLLEAKRNGHLSCIGPTLQRMADSGMWLSEDTKRRALTLADEA
jgi:predicted nucleic acid-binding protein